MIPQQIIVTSSNSPKSVGIDHNGGPLSVVATPTAADYGIEFTVEPLQDLTNAPNYVPISNMTAATTQQEASLSNVTGLRITLNSGTSVAVGLSQSGV